MGRLKRIYDRLFKKLDIFPYDIIDMDYSDARIIFGDEIIYELDLDWDNGLLDIEFGVQLAKVPDTTNAHEQYKIMNTISYLVKLIIQKIEYRGGCKIHSIIFLSSKFRNSKIDNRAAEIRNKLFVRYAMREFPNAEVVDTTDESKKIKLNRV